MGKLREGDKVEARFGGRDKWYAGKITNARSDGTFDILYEDGDTERRVKKRLIRKKKGGSKKKNRRESGSDNDSDDDKLREGDKVEARFGSRDKWYKGKIVNARSDGTFDILYEDGDTERRVKKRLIRKKKGGSKNKKKRDSGSDNDSDDDKLREGDK